MNNLLKHRKKNLALDEKELRNAILFLKLSYTYSAIAEEYGVSSGVIHRIMKEDKFPVRPDIRKVLGLADMRRVLIHSDKIDTCHYRHCAETYIRWAHNKKYCTSSHGDKERNLLKQETGE